VLTTNIGRSGLHPRRHKEPAHGWWKWCWSPRHVVLDARMSTRQFSTGRQRVWVMGSNHLTDPQHTTHAAPPAERPLSAPLGQVLALRNQTLVKRAGQHRDAVPADLIAEVLAGDKDTTRAREFQDVSRQVVPLFSGGARGSRASSRRRRRATTPVHVADWDWGQAVHWDPRRRVCAAAQRS